MRLPTPVLGLCCFLLGGSTLAVSATHPSKRSFNPRQKWERDEINCVRIFNPTTGSTFRPGYFVRMSYGAEQCGFDAAKPWTIHLYNNPEIERNGEIRYDYHEVIAEGLNEHSGQYLWTIPAAQQSMEKSVKKTNDYYVRVETSARDGTKLVGNAGPFTISPNQVSKREDLVDVNDIVNTDITPKVTENSLEEPVIASNIDEASLAEPAIAPVTPVVDSKFTPIDTGKVEAVNGAPSVLDEIKPVPKPPVTEVSSQSIIPNKLLVGVAVVGGALGLGYLGGSLFSQAGAVIGTALGGIVGGLIVLLSFLNPLSYY
ncbi:hypothetical protein BGZ76_001769 [Entomortierella beljakovae]|nr:hypothetical protein BGZ76_001769 [Entomortierella beljakovae]